MRARFNDKQEPSLARDTWSAPRSEGSPVRNVCYLRNLDTDEPLTSMNGMARGRATSSLSPEPTEPTEP